MGSINEKLTYLKETKNKIKEAIVAKGVPVDDNATFRSYPDKITQIESATINNQEKTVTSNGVVTPDTGYTGLSKVTVNTPVIKNQSKTVTQNGTVTPDTGYTGLSDVIVNVATGITPTGTISITENGTHDVTNYASAEVNVANIQYIPREVTSDGVLQLPSQKFVFTLPSNIKSLGEHALSNVLGYGSNNITSVDLSNIINIKAYGLYSTFNSCNYITSVNLSNLVKIDDSGLYSAFNGARRLKSIDLSSLASIDYRGLYRAFQDTSLTSISFPALTPSSFGNFTNQFEHMLQSVQGCTVHFPSNLKSVIGSWEDVTKGFHGSSTVTLFDLPTTS